MPPGNGSLDRVLGLLEEAAYDSVPEGERYRVLCPVYKGHSLILKQGHTNVVAQYHGCGSRFEDITRAAGIPAKAFSGYDKLSMDRVRRNIERYLKA
jgi:hypothetical protein